MRYEARRIRSRPRRGFWRPRDFPPNVRNCFSGPLRRACADYWDISGEGVIQRKRAHRGPAMRNARPTGHVGNRIWPDGTRDVADGASLTSSGGVASGTRRLTGILGAYKNPSGTSSTWGGVRNMAPGADKAAAKKYGSENIAGAKKLR